MTSRNKTKLSGSSIPPSLAAIMSALTYLAAAASVHASPIPLDDHSYRSFDWSRHYRLDRPAVFEPLDVHDLSLQFSNRYYYTDDTSQVDNRWILHFADSIVFRDIDFNFRIRLDYPGSRVRDAGWTSEKAGEANDLGGYVYDPDRIVAYYTPSEHFRFGFGKERYNWGPLELGGLMLSDHNEGFTGFYQQYALGGFVLRGMTAQLNSTGDRSNPTHRYFSAARLEYNRPNYGAAFGQSVLYAGAGRSLELQYLFPFYIYHYGQMTANHGYGGGQNTQGSLDGYAKIYKLPLEAYGELLVDDYQGHSDEVSQSIQNAVSWMAGLRLKDAGAWYGFAEGGMISTYTYNNMYQATRYMVGRSFIGSPLGPDQQLVWGKFGRTFSVTTYSGYDTVSADLNFWLRRSGERRERNGVLYDINMTGYRGTRDDPQPYYDKNSDSSAVEDEMSFWTSVSYRKYFVGLELKGGMTMYKNRGNVKSDDWTRYPFAGIFLTSGISSSARK